MLIRAGDDPAKVDRHTPIDEQPSVIRAHELKELGATCFIREVCRESKREVIVVRLTLIPVELPIDRVELIGYEFVDTLAVAHELNRVRRRQIHAQHVAVPLAK